MDDWSGMNRINPVGYLFDEAWGRLETIGDHVDHVDHVACLLISQLSSPISAPIGPHCHSCLPHRFTMRSRSQETVSTGRARVERLIAQVESVESREWTKKWCVDFRSLQTLLTWKVLIFHPAKTSNHGIWRMTQKKNHFTFEHFPVLMIHNSSD